MGKKKLPPRKTTYDVTAEHLERLEAIKDKYASPRVWTQKEYKAYLRTVERERKRYGRAFKKVSQQWQKWRGSRESSSTA